MSTKQCVQQDGANEDKMVTRLQEKDKQQDRGSKNAHKYYSEEKSKIENTIMAENIKFGNKETTATQNYQNKENSKGYSKSKSKGVRIKCNRRNNDDNNIKMEDITIMVPISQAKNTKTKSKT
eukprot:8219911-Ditylum_brightwellii.AAC.1